MNKQHSHTTPTSDPQYQTIIDQEIRSSAKCIGMTEDVLKLWLDQYSWVHFHTLSSFLHLIKKYQLDPLVGEISIIKSTDGSCQAYITFDGWCKIINQHPQYAGMSLRESSAEGNNMPLWMECTIYRNDRILPVVVNEYLVEVKTDHISWKQMPKRMLRHRVIQQCARLAFGIGAPESIVLQNPVMETPEFAVTDLKESNGTYENLSQTEKLKKKLVHV